MGVEGSGISVCSRCGSRNSLKVLTDSVCLNSVCMQSNIKSLQMSFFKNIFLFFFSFRFQSMKRNLRAKPSDEGICQSLT